MEVDFFVTIEQLEKLIEEAKKATKDIGVNEMFFNVYKPLTNKPIGLSGEESAEYLRGKFNIHQERIRLPKDDKLGETEKNIEMLKKAELSFEMREHIEEYHNEFVLCEICKKYHHKSEIMGIGCDVCKSCFNNPKET